jgi:surface antigen
MRKTMRRRLVRTSLLVLNLVVLAVVGVFVAQDQHRGGSKTVASAAANTPVANPLDQLSSADIALTIARMNSLPESTAITSQAISQSVELTQAPTTNNVVAKPQVIATSLKSKADIQSYVSQAGDTVSSLATKFGVTSDSIRWSNSLGSSDMLTTGQKLMIPPVTGIVYTVQAGDTVDSLATKYKASSDKIIAFNDAEITGVTTGEQIIIPDGTVTPTFVAPRVSVASSSSNAASFPWGGMGPLYGSNGYDYGYCTWYVATRIAVPSNWGNASTWDNLAPISGWTVSTTPQAGGVGQNDFGAGGLGHVAYIEAVSDDGTMVKYSDMNGLAGFGHVGFSDWVPISHFQHYIYH